MTEQISLAGLDADTFVERFGGLYEHSPWIAAGAWPGISGQADISMESLLQGLREVVEAAAEEQQLALIRAHPDLAGKAAVRGELTAESTHEQARARLDQCSTDEFDRFQQLNTNYKERFGFPFVMAVRERSRAEILQAFEQRCQNAPAQEFRAALDNIHEIARLRLQAMR